MPKAPKLTVEMVPTADLIPYINNAKLHPEEHVNQIAASIQEFGFNDPIAVDGENGIIEGHGRLLAALKLKMGKVPIIKLDHLSPAQKKAYTLAHNKLTMVTGFDADLLKLEMEALAEEGFDLGLTGFQEEEIQAIIDGLEGVDVSAHTRRQAQGDVDEAPEPPEQPFTMPGDLYQIGPHRLLCGDSTVLADVEKLMDGEKAGCAVTDPPYAFSMASTAGKKGETNGWGDMINMSSMFSNIQETLRDLVQDGPLWIFCNWRTLPMMMKASMETSIGIESVLVWYKDWIGPGGCRGLRPTYELVTLSCLGQYGIPNRGIQDFFKAPWSSHKPNGHQAEKPVLLLEHLLNVSERDSVVDLFGRSGTTMVAAHQTDRRAFLMEIDPHYCDVIVARMKRLFPDLPVTRNGEPVE